jgi:hypothetical protein
MPYVFVAKITLERGQTSLPKDHYSGLDTGWFFFNLFTALSKDRLIP